MLEFLKGLRRHLLTGVSFAIPFIAAGGILIALSIALVPMGDKGPNFENHPHMRMLLNIGVASFTLMLPVLAGYIAYSIAGKPGLVAGFIGGWLSGHLGVAAHVAGQTEVELSAGFLGAIVAGLLAGYLVEAIKRIPTHKFVKPIMPILIIPIVSSVVIGLLMLLVIGPPIAGAMNAMSDWLQGLHAQPGKAVPLAMILGAMIAFDMGGPVNKVAFFFASGLISQGNIYLMGPVAAAICTPPLGMGLATLIGRKLWREEHRDSGYAALGMGMIGITEGAIPFAAADPIRVIPCIMLGSMTASTVAMLARVGDHAPHGGPIVLPVVEGKWMYVLAILVGTLVTALAINGLKTIWKLPGDREGAAA